MKENEKLTLITRVCAMNYIESDSTSKKIKQLKKHDVLATKVDDGILDQEIKEAYPELEPWEIEDASAIDLEMAIAEIFIEVILEKKLETGGPFSDTDFDGYLFDMITEVTSRHGRLDIWKCLDDYFLMTN